MLTAIATSKSTVLGLRLDHERRAWVEAAASQAGLSVRGFFETLIDRARLEASGERSGESPNPDAPYDPDHLAGTAAAGSASFGGAVAHLDAAVDAPAQTPSDAPPAAASDAGPVPPAPARPHPAPDVPRALLLPGQVLGAATSATATLIESGGRCLRDTWRVFIVALIQGVPNDGE